jgi:hypothetical protein
VCEVDMLNVRARGFNKYGFSQFVIWTKYFLIYRDIIYMF